MPTISIPAKLTLWAASSISLSTTPHLCTVIHSYPTSSSPTKSHPNLCCRFTVPQNRTNLLYQMSIIVFLSLFLLFGFPQNASNLLHHFIHSHWTTIHNSMKIDQYRSPQHVGHDIPRIGYYIRNFASSSFSISFDWGTRSWTRSLRLSPHVCKSGDFCESPNNFVSQPLGDIIQVLSSPSPPPGEAILVNSIGELGKTGLTGFEQWSNDI